MGSAFKEIWEAHRTGRALGSYEELVPDLVFGHEATIGLILDDLTRLGGPKLDPSKLFFVADHFAPPSSGPFADILSDFRRFCAGKGIPIRLFEGIGHRLMLESDRVREGMLVIGADSHTTTVGGKGALGIGLGSSDVLAALMTGTVWLARPQVQTVHLQGALRPNAEAKDVMLHLLSRFGQEGFRGQVVEFHAPPRFSIESHCVLTNMSVEMGAVSAIGRAGDGDGHAGEGRAHETVPSPSVGEGRAHETVLSPSVGEGRVGGALALDLSSIESLVARPGAPDDVVPAASLSDVRIDTAVLGSCASGGMEDLETGVRLLAGRHVHTGVSLLVTPATNGIFSEAARKGIISALLEAGATILNPSCGACGGIDKGIPGSGDVMISTAPRNFSARARVGSTVYLASTATVVASAIAGRIVAPEDGRWSMVDGRSPRKEAAHDP